ncbi:rho GTPase-activating protein 20-like [Ochotona curzoniae]|uniref:rho GTPase-activating protein 20-like n=1 Tax=Ochotona curzoniae TaxID=130825 RepID=UPI001B34B46F|nr:rho GTPase-activating protein 20-like [Ochotona curzoniae]
MNNFSAKFSSVAFKEKWSNLLERYITHAKELEGVSSSLIKIDVKNINNCSRSGIVTVNSLDTAKDVIRMVLPVLGLTGSEKDYQLWVHGGKNVPPFPLMGHEHPYVIQEHYHEFSPDQCTPEKSTSPSSVRQSIPKILMYRQLQFVLKCRDKPRSQLRGGFLRSCLSCWRATTVQNDPPQDTDSSVELNVPQMDDLARTILVGVIVLS